MGLTEAGLPELIVVGVSHEIGFVMLNKLAQRSLAEELEIGRKYDLANGDRVLTFLIGQVSRANSRKYLLAAGHHYGQHKVEALQVFWPSERGLFLEDSGWDLREIQPALA